MTREAFMFGEPLLVENARAAIRAGKLPARSPERTMGGPGCGEPCAICGEILRQNQMELEAEFTRHDGEMPESAKYHVHPACFATWESERGKIEGASG